jgi:hypothetical protein
MRALLGGRAMMSLRRMAGFTVRLRMHGVGRAGARRVSKGSSRGS